jgi:hypothetical protein
VERNASSEELEHELEDVEKVEGGDEEVHFSWTLTVVVRVCLDS